MADENASSSLKGTVGLIGVNDGLAACPIAGVMGSQFSSPTSRSPALPDLRAYFEQQKLRAYLGQQKLAHVREAKQPRQDIIKAALAKTLALAFAECRLLGFDSGAPWCPHRVERRASPQFVSRLFDDYARQFEPMLLETLNYCAHARVADLISEHRRDGRILDAGCGSGLLGAELRKRSPETELFGVDVSSKIAKLARDKRDAAGRPVYDEVVVGDLVDARAYGSRSFDVVAASDVCCYFGDLERLFETLSRVLEPDGLVAFTTETDEAAEDAPEGPNAGGGRYAHGDAYVDRAAAAVGWSRVSKARFTPRREAGRPVEGTLWLFRRRRLLGAA